MEDPKEGDEKFEGGKRYRYGADPTTGSSYWREHKGKDNTVREGYKAGAAPSNKSDADLTDEEIGKMSPVMAAGARARRARARASAQGEALKRMAGQ